MEGERAPTFVCIASIGGEIVYSCRGENKECAPGNCRILSIKAGCS